MESLFNIFFIGVDLYIVFKDVQLLAWMFQGELPPKLRPPAILDLIPRDPSLSLKTWVVSPVIGPGQPGLDKLPEKYFPEFKDIMFYNQAVNDITRKNDFVVTDYIPEHAVSFQFRGRKIGDTTFGEKYKNNIFYSTGLYEIDPNPKNSINY